MIVFVSCLVLIAAILVYIRKKKSHEFQYIQKAVLLYERLPLDLRIAVFIITVIIAFQNPYPGVLNTPFTPDSVIILTLLAIYIFYLILNIVSVKNLIQGKVRLHSQWQGCLIYWLISLIKDSFIVKSVLFKTALVVALTILYGGFLGLAVSAHSNGASDALPIAFLATLIYIFTVLLYILSKLRLFNKILKGTEDIVSGNFNSIIESQGKGKLSKLADNINNMKDGVKKALESQIKSERLKTELITNVSHDLKTPLTSIINYVDLLKRNDLSQEEIQGYVAVLDRKAQRLKVLIEDLFEASKLSSGTVELNAESLDVAALLHQALAEFDEKIKESSLTFKVNAVKQKIYAELDGKKTWRVFENLISNILKYSQHNTRVYIDLEDHQDKVVLVMKNVSAYELDFDADEIFERFKRGDRSRNTEGSGLGLAIAKSIVELQGGRLSIEIDGDLFKVIVEFCK